jgi:hypothetical protein
MGLLFYDNEPGQQLLLDSAFGTAFPNFWTGVNAVRDSSNTAFPEAMSPGGYNGVKFQEEGASISQEGQHLVLSGEHTAGILILGNASIVLFKYALLDENLEELFVYEDELRNISESSFSNNHVTFTIPDSITGYSGKITYTLGGNSFVNLSNPKLETGDTPTQWSPNTGESEIQGIPASFETESSPLEDSQDQFDYLTSYDQVDGSFSAGSSGITPGGSVQELKPGDVSGGVNYQGLLAEFDKFIENERDISKSLRQQSVNQKDVFFYPDEKELECLKFTRDKLKQHMNMIDATNTRSRAFVSWARAKLAGMRRAYEMRMHSRINYYSFGFIDSWMKYISLQEEYDLVHVGAGTQEASRSSGGVSG